MEISFDPVKSEKNRRERGLPFERAAEFDFSSAITLPTFRNSEVRWEAFGYLYDRLHLLCYKQVDNRSIRVDDLIDEDEVPELMEEDFAQMVPFDELPEELKAPLRELMAGNVTIRPDPVKMPVSLVLSSDVVDKFTATGEGWESRVDSALRQWLEEHPLPVEHAKAS